MSQGKATIQVVGTLTKDCEVRFTNAQMAIVKFGVAVNTKYKEKEEVCFLDCVAFGKSGEAFAKYFKRGSVAVFDGRVKMDSWDDKATGQKRTKLIVSVDQWYFAGSAGGERSSQAPSTSSEPAAQGTTMDDPDSTPVLTMLPYIFVALAVIWVGQVVWFLGAKAMEAKECSANTEWR